MIVTLTVQRRVRGITHALLAAQGGGFYPVIPVTVREVPN